jgi:hypothetical protein
VVSEGMRKQMRRSGIRRNEEADEEEWYQKE